MMKLPNMKRWSDQKLDREFAFAVMASDADHPENLAWVAAVKDEHRRRKSLVAA